MAPYLVVFGVAAVVTFLLTPAVWRLATHFGAVVQPGERRIHLRPTPTLGGTAMLAALYAALVVAWWMPKFRPVFESSSEPVGVALAATVIFAVGFLDDLREVSAPAKVAGQVLAASVLGLAGVTMFYFRIPFADFYVLSPDLGFLFTVIWVVAMANAVNLIDGLDGLAAGVVAIAAGAFFVYAYRLSEVGLLAPDNMAPLVVAITCGLCVGFLPHNFHPAKVFMGDSGAMLLGLLLAATTISVGGRTADQFSGQTFFFFAPLVIPFVILGVPFVDTALAIIRRARRRTALSLADKEHLHHKLMNQGHGPRRSVFILWAWTAILAGVVLVPTYTNQGNAVVPFAVIGLAVVLYTLLHPGVRQTARQLEEEVDAPDQPAPPEPAGVAGPGPPPPG
ncbi:MAG: UDP-GlcNAc:undecaprenyl-phosphate/decaprenyl-phosphate GlcNAc-phosphate transferase [Actinomycetota bacterium]|jgi:UDP-GlcNAc:undecaprenyl-phosphate GlcNAc-1-phosphate transferase|nr:UDP-GlcNAc:undecaprenyl-phosphate/decaprenyl-phosphate GlcNAc-phosphate transferase [Actinomycetota bacterium]